MLQPKKRRELSEAEFRRVFREVRTDINALQLHDKVFCGVNRHSLIWDASTHSNKTISEDDYKWLFNYLRRGMKIKSLVENREFERLRKRITALRNTGS